MDTSTQATELIPVKSQMGVKPKRQYRTIEEKRRVVEETLVEGASVARVARGHGINANLVFNWRKLYLAGRLGGASRAIKLLPVRVNESSPSPATTIGRECSASVDLAKPTPGTIQVELRHAQVRIEGSVDPALVRVLLECLGR
jgi:transposase